MACSELHTAAQGVGAGPPPRGRALLSCSSGMADALQTHGGLIQTVLRLKPVRLLSQLDGKREDRNL